MRDAEGIQRVACASSVNALGYQFGVKRFDIRCLPIGQMRWIEEER